jgi:heparin/heparan-sulfate lyase
MGQIFMRSGWGDDDTYALFTAGGACDKQRHYDENTFVIYRKGFLALDSGTRPEPGNHMFQYYCRTVAHNGILLRREGETLPTYWGRCAPGEPDLPTPNDGGMCSLTGAQIRAFQTCPDFTYIASDATACYASNKCELALRQFVHIQPSFFVIFDRVISVRPEYKKTWLLHTAREPRIEGAMFSAVQDGGRIFCRTLLPTNATVTKIGGPGKEFWNDGRNWPIPSPVPSWMKKPSELMGAWRVEVTPAGDEKETLFLHFLEAGLVNAKERACNIRATEEGALAGVEVACDGATYRVLFGTGGDPVCRVAIDRKDGRVEHVLNCSVQPQAGWAETSSPKTNRPLADN